MKTLLVLALLCSLLRAACADAISGPERTTIIKQDWGTIYHLPFSPDTHMSEDILGEFTIKTGRGRSTSIKQEGYNKGYLVYYPDEKVMTVRKTEGGEIKIDFRGKECYFRPSPSGWVLHTPTDEIRLSKKGNELTLSGRLGKTVVVEGPNGFSMKSGAGETSYAREDFDRPFKLTGIPVQGHPYVVRGVWFETQGVGAFIDFKLADYSRAFTVLGWYPMMQVEGN